MIILPAANLFNSHAGCLTAFFHKMAKNTLFKSFPPGAGALLVFLFTMWITLLAWRGATSHLEQEIQGRFDTRAAWVVTQVKQRLNDYQNLILGLQGLFIGSGEVSRKEFHDYYEVLQLQRRLPGLRAISFQRRVPHREKEAYIAATRRDRSVDPLGYPDFTILPPGERAEYLVIDYIEPMAGNRPALGIDAATQPANHAAIALARDTGHIAISPPFRIAQSPPGTNHVVLRAPIYRNGLPGKTIEQRRTALTGFAVLTLNMNDSFREFFRETELKGEKIIIRDIGQADGRSDMGGTDKDKALTLFDTRTAPFKPTLERSSTLEFGGRKWQIIFCINEGWAEAGNGPDHARLILAGGLIISLLLAALFFSLARSKVRAMVLADRMTRQLREREQRLSALADLSSDWYWEQDAQHRFTDLVGKAHELARLNPDQVRGKTRWEALPEALSPGQWEEHRKILDARQPFEIEYRSPAGDGQLRWIYVKGTPRFADDGAFIGYHGTAQDVTARHEAAEKLERRTAVLQATLENMAQGISVIDRDLRLIGHNKRFLELLGFPESLIHEGTTFEDFIRYNAERGEYGPGNIEDQVRSRVTLARQFAPHRLKRVRPNGTVLDILGTPLPGGGMVTTYTDITEQERAAAAMRLSEQRYRTLIEMLPDAVFVHRNLRILLANEAALKLCAATAPGQVIGHGMLEFIHPGSHQLVIQRIKALESATYPVTRVPMVEQRYRRVDGTAVPVEASATRIELEGGPAVLSVIRDITDRKLAEEAFRRERDFTQKVIDSLPGVFYVIDQKRRFVMWNQNLERAFGRSHDELRQTNPLDLIDGQDRQAVDAAISRVFLDGEANVEGRLVTADGGRIPYYLNGLRMELEGQTVLVGVGFDISARKRAEEMVRKINEILEQRVRERTAELEASNQELESFSYSVSHDLRTPLRALDGFSQIIEEDYGDRLDEEGRSYLRRIRTASRRMGKLIDDLLDLARIGRQELNPVEVDLSKLAEEVREALLEHSSRRKATWNIAPGLVARADPVLIKVVLDNLLRNAWKFTAEQADARIEFGQCRTESGDAFYVRDNGAGFEMAYIDKLFKPFQRLHDIKRFEGTGIGLAIVQRIVRRHHGRVWAESRPNEGATFYFTVP